MTQLHFEIFRKLIHLFQILIIIGYLFLAEYTSQRVGLLALTGLLLILLEFEYFRVDYRTKLGTRFTRFLAGILRKHEHSNVTSAVFFTMSTIISFSVFDTEIALLALSMTVFGDLSAALVGTALGQKKVFRNKTYIGSFAGFIINILLGVYLMPDNPDIFIPVALTATIVEAVTHKLDDNLTVPLFAGFVGQMIQMIG